jgi:hypothetical protein
MLSLIPDPLTEEAAYIAAAVREGSFTAQEIVTRACARARLPANEARARARDVQARVASLLLPGVPFVTDGIDDSRLTALTRAGAILIGHTADAARLVANGAAAFAVVCGEAGEGVHRLRPAGESLMLLARSSRDLALVFDALSPTPSANVAAALCRPLRDSVGHGSAGLTVAAVRVPLVVALLAPTCSVTMLAVADASLLQNFDAVIASQTIDPSAATLSWPSDVSPQLIQSRSTDTVIRIGAALDAASFRA